MYGNLVLQGDDPQDSVPKLFNTTPESGSVSFLALNPDRIFQYLDAPFLLKIRPFPQNFILKICGVLVACHTELGSFLET